MFSILVLLLPNDMPMFWSWSLVSGNLARDITVMEGQNSFYKLP